MNTNTEILEPTSSTNEAGCELRYFSQASILEQIGGRRLARFLRDYAPEVQECGDLLPAFDAEGENFDFDLFAAAFARSEGFPGKLRNVLLRIDAAAAPENAEL